MFTLCLTKLRATQLLFHSTGFDMAFSLRYFGCLLFYYYIYIFGSDCCFCWYFYRNIKIKINKCPKYKRDRGDLGVRAREPLSFDFPTSKMKKQKKKNAAASKRFGAVQFAFIFIDTKGLKLIDMFLVPCMLHTGFQLFALKAAF